MLSMCMGWFRKRLYKRRREQLLATFHNNSNNLYLHVITGLELLTEPLEYNSENYAPLPLFGRIDSSVADFNILQQRLEWHLENFERVIRGGDYHPIPDALSRQKDLPLPRWKDQFFQTTSSDIVRQQLAVIRQLLVTYEAVYFNRHSRSEEDVLWRQTQPVLRELEIIVEHFL
ncbi:hypothetical protein HOV30_gp203 [Erwinia phage Derbicus]|uniref:Uncharacterized protein n=1 Tax=Erwinia phage Derbicus TaxID=2530027 RepID=A0A482IKD4_9CAUD|nr:hypothetical protein HOV30_gp203 [Erwinia phage Derbicus]QBP07629.1 hypothetical protein DERBICUS_203 [Erwinia phage Derbicus]